MGKGIQQVGWPEYLQSFFKSLNGRYRRIRKRCKGQPCPEAYTLKKEQLAEVERLCEQGFVDLFYGDESHVCSTGYVPYGWQFPGEEVFIPVEKGYKINIWGLISRTNKTHWITTEKGINANFIFTQLEELSFKIRKPTVVVVDNASIHKAQLIQRQLPFWEQRGLHLFYLPTYSPHLNIAETLWRKVKKEQLDPGDYLNKDTLFYAVNRCLAQVGNLWKINFAPFNIN